LKVVARKSHTSPAKDEKVRAPSIEREERSPPRGTTVSALELENKRKMVMRWILSSKSFIHKAYTLQQRNLNWVLGLSRLGEPSSCRAAGKSVGGSSLMQASVSECPSRATGSLVPSTSSARVWASQKNVAFRRQDWTRCAPI